MSQSLAPRETVIVLDPSWISGHTRQQLANLKENHALSGSPDLDLLRCIEEAKKPEAPYDDVLDFGATIGATNCLLILLRMRFLATFGRENLNDLDYRQAIRFGISWHHLQPRKFLLPTKYLHCCLFGVFYFTFFPLCELVDVTLWLVSLLKKITSIPRNLTTLLYGTTLLLGFMTAMMSIIFYSVILVYSFATILIYFTALELFSDILANPFNKLLRPLLRKFEQSPLTMLAWTVGLITVSLAVLALGYSCPALFPWLTQLNWPEIVRLYDPLYRLALGCAMLAYQPIDIRIRLEITYFLFTTGTLFVDFFSLLPITSLTTTVLLIANQISWGILFYRLTCGNTLSQYNEMFQELPKTPIPRSLCEQLTQDHLPSQWACRLFNKASTKPVLEKPRTNGYQP